MQQNVLTLSRKVDECKPLRVGAQRCPVVRAGARARQGLCVIRQVWRLCPLVPMEGRTCLFIPSEASLSYSLLSLNERLQSILPQQLNDCYVALNSVSSGRVRFISLKIEDLLTHSGIASRSDLCRAARSAVRFGLF